MLFNSLGFLLFFPFICCVYWLIRYIWGGERTLFVRNSLLLAGSYYFYMCWQPKYALLLLFSTAVTYVCAIFIDRSDKVKIRKLWLIAAVVVNIAILFFYKYYGFVADSISAIMGTMGMTIHIPGLKVLLPVGISFYIFQALGYLIDVYRKDIVSEKNFITYALFVSFFPQLVAGPIERSTNLLPQFKKDREFNYDFAISGFKLMLWGYFLKLCMADRASIYVDKVFNSIGSHEGYSTLIASLLFSLQIYGDFAGYSLIAIGCARILGFSLNDNFKRPYFSVSITDFWHRWHISLSSWLRDYIYFPLGGSKTSKLKTYRNILATFAISGLWHGANWTFVLWGVLHGIVQCIERALGLNKKQFRSWSKLLHIVVTFLIANCLWVLFRANTIGDAMIAFQQMFSLSDLTFFDDSFVLYYMIVVGIIVFVKDFIDEQQYCKTIKPWISNYLWPIFLMLCIGCLGVFEGGQFIYFQF